MQDLNLDINSLVGIMAVTGGIILWIIEIMPGKAKPWSRILNAIGKLINADLMAEINEVKTTVTDLAKETNENERDRIRYEILQFSNSCQAGIEHTQEEFNHVVTMHQKYEVLLEKMGEENGQITVAYDYIVSLYKELLRERKFTGPYEAVRKNRPNCEVKRK